MKRFLLFFLSGFLFAQVDFFGYVETEFDAMRFKDETYGFGYSKLRMNFESMRDDVAIAGNVNVQKYYGKTTWDLFDFLPDEIWKPLFQPSGVPDSLWVTEFPLEIQDTLYMDNLYARMSFPKFDITVGRQPISLGSGYAWNPTDFFNQKSLMDPTYEQPGIMAYRLEIPFGYRGLLDIALAPDENWDKTTKMVLLKSGISAFDVSVSWTETDHFIPYWRFADMAMEREKAQYAGFALVGQIGDMGLWSEGTHSSRTVDHLEFILGTDYTFSNGTYILAEYLSNSLGAEKGTTEFRDYSTYFSGETHSLNQHYIFSMVRHGLTDYISLGCFTIGNLDDESWMISPTLDWDMKYDVSLSVYYSISLGDDQSEFGLQEDAFRIRLRAHF